MNTERKTRILLITGPGKGKTTSALGMVMRAVGHAMRVSFIQFIKSRTDTGEARALALLPNVEHLICGKGFVAGTADDRSLHCRGAKEGLERATERLTDPAIDMVVLDEICGAIALKLIPETDVVKAVNIATPGKIIILTGRDACASLRSIADTISVIDSPVHGMNAGFPAQRGVEC